MALRLFCLFALIGLCRPEIRQFAEETKNATDDDDKLKSEYADEKNPVRNTIYGPVRGYSVEEKGIVADVFTRVPYAKAPIGKLRFKSPVPPDKWQEPKDATKPSPWCIQFWYPDPRISLHREQSEDCLFLNIFVPKNYTTPGPYAVVVWVHGGSFTVNGGNIFPVDGIVRNIVKEGIIFITLNYRLGPLGFLATLNKELPGNYGLEDQIMALQWVQDNIRNFNGDPNRVTFGGESAGAACVSLLSISPRSQGLFHRAITRSGSSLAPWAVRSTNTNFNSLILIEHSECVQFMPDMKTVRQCLQTLPVGNLTKIWKYIGNNDLMYIISAKKHATMGYNHPFLAHTYFTPVVDAFRQNFSVIPDHPEDMMEKNIRVPLMTGVTTGECTAYVSWLYFLTSSNVPIQLSDLEYVVPHVIYANPEQVKQAVYSDYVAKNFDAESFNYAKILIKIASHQNFVAHVVLEAELYAKAGQKVYAYIFDHDKDELNQKHNKQGVYDFGASHGYDMVFLVQSSGALDPVPIPMNWTSADLFITEFLAKSIANWAKFGDPSAQDLPAYWPPHTAECGKALVFAPNPKITSFYPESKRFWWDTVPLIDQLTFEKGYQFHNPAKCVKHCSTDFKLAFVVAIFVGILLLLAGIMAICLTWLRKRDSYQVDSNCSSTQIIPS